MTELQLDDLRFETYYEGGIFSLGGNTGVRVTHIPTGEQVTVDAHKSQLRNKDEAVAILRHRLTYFH